MPKFREGKMELRSVLAHQLIKQAKQFPVYALDADLASSSGLHIFESEYPERFINCGIQEANMFGIAAAMAKEGLIPFVHTFAAFASRRALDQLYVSAIYNNASIKIIASDPGILNSANGGTHVVFEDIGIISSLPNIKIVDFTDAVMIKNLIPKIIDDNNSYYLRLQRKTTDILYDEEKEFEVGKAVLLSEGSDIALICNSAIALKEAIKAKEELEKDGFSVAVIDMFTVKPIDKDIILYLANKCKVLATVENSGIKNGVGTAVADVLISNRQYAELIKFGIPERLGEVGDYAYLIRKYGFDAKSIADGIKLRIQLL